eukprot:TRINITY_DN7538_c0_g1_i1.p1 TRINITY_DN7538_c0_g1~~TRINITY_DN7538_c0_g1_i1.p1  ORF type:complete len:100 (+),score=10.82 TRINITY_DN7538_c0_g1_i1:111-410(+)
MSNATSLFGALGSRRRDSSTHTTGQDAEEVVSGKRKRRSPSPEELGHYTINPGESIGRGRCKSPISTYGSSFDVFSFPLFLFPFSFFLFPFFFFYILYG